MHVSQLLAWRFLKGSTHQKNISLMIKVCFISIFISTTALVIITAIAHGFEQSTHKKLQGIHSDIIIRSPHQQPLDFIKIKSFLQSNPDTQHLISGLSPSSTQEVILQNDTTNLLNPNKTPTNNTTLIGLKGIEPYLESQVSSLETMLIDKSTSLPELLTEDTLIIGTSLAQTLGLKPGDSVKLLIPSDTQLNKNKITLDNYTVKVAGFFDTGIEEVDEHIAYCSLDLFNKLFDTGITTIHIKLNPSVKIEGALPILKKHLSLPVNSWKDFYPALVSALVLEKYVLIIILGLITVIACMNIISLLFMYITQKRGEIALLYAMGLRYNKIILIFILVGVELSAFASLAGIATGSFISILLEKYPFIRLPDAYYVSYLPAKMDYILTLKLYIIIVLISFLASWIGIRFLKYQSTSSLLKGL